MVKSELSQAGIFPDINKQFYNDEGYIPHSNSKPYYKLTCFEDLYLSMRSGIWMQKSYNLIDFRVDSAKTVGNM